eukprot:5960672-Pleurochrysis_carterae.AAC.1
MEMAAFVDGVAAPESSRLRFGPHAGLEAQARSRVFWRGSGRGPARVGVPTCEHWSACMRECWRAGVPACRRACAYVRAILCACARARACSCERTCARARAFVRACARLTYLRACHWSTWRVTAHARALQTCLFAHNTQASELAQARVQHCARLRAFAHTAF